MTLARFLTDTAEDIDLAAHKVQVESARPAADLAAAIRDAGFTPEPLA